MPTYRFRLVNVFASEPLLGPSALAGNPLCVFEDARGMDERAMMALARQFNLSETTFLLPPSDDDAHMRVRIFTPTHDPKLAEMRFAGHPTLGSAHVVRDLLGGGDAVTLELPAGRVPVQGQGDTWTLTAPFDGEPRVQPESMPAVALAALLGLEASDLAGEPTWVDTGMEQLLVPLRSVEAVRRALPVAGAEADWPRSRSDRRNTYVFAFSGEVVGDRREVAARFFINAPGSGLYEDPGTGSACANLGGWLLHTGAPLPARILVQQGREMARPCRLQLDVDVDRRVRVGGKVVEIARGDVTLP